MYETLGLHAEREGCMLDHDQVVSYILRLGFGNESVKEIIANSPSVSTLDKLVDAQQTNVPFETTVINRGGLAPSLDTTDLFEKIVIKRRGGYCFELNKLFEQLLLSLGFNVRPILCRAVRGREVRMPINHRGLLISLEGVDRFADVGFGGPMPPASVVLADGAVQTFEGAAFKTVRLDETWWALMRETKSGADPFDDDRPSQWQVELELCCAKVEDDDFNSLNVAFSSPGTLFRDRLIVNLRTKTGNLALTDNKLTIRKDGKKEIIDVDDKEIFDTLKERFDLDYPEYR